ncbi:DUF6236 family protein [Janthinobacterium sp. RB2P8]|uniref:DUF6236 family protein n=1 Tax=Janthinobacterium sp. RB2P8 TaxID=3424191 RepID=UPI003F27C619
MGEAKRRKTTEASFGTIPKIRPYRGLIISPPLEINGTNLHIKSTSIDAQELRFSLLFWDKLIWPSSRNIYIGSGPEEKFLESAGILSRPDYTFNGDGAQGIARGQMQAFRDRNLTEPGVWALAQGENSFTLLGEKIDENTGSLIELHRAIPLPTREVPLADILEFKEKRRDELWVLRNTLESFVFCIENSHDKEHELKKTISELDRACSDLISLGKEWRFPVYLSNLKASFNLAPTKFLPSVIAGWKVGEPYGLTAASIAAGSAGMVSTIDIKADWGFRSIKNPMSPYRYAYHIEREL